MHTFVFDLNFAHLENAFIAILGWEVGKKIYKLATSQFFLRIKEDGKKKERSFVTLRNKDLKRDPMLRKHTEELGYKSISKWEWLKG